MSEYKVEMVANDIECCSCGCVSDKEDFCFIDADSEEEAIEEAKDWFEQEHGVNTSDVSVISVELTEDD